MTIPEFNISQKNSGNILEIEDQYLDLLKPIWD